MIDMIVESNGNVSIVSTSPKSYELFTDFLSQLDDTGELHPLDTYSATPAAISRTWPLVLARYLISKVTRRAPKSDEHLENDGADESESGSESPSSRATTPNNEAAPTVLKGGRTATVKAGGKRRKAVRKR
jgi:DnaJ family protein C protein 1